MTAPEGTRTDLQVRWRYHFLDFLTGTPLAVLPLFDVKLDDALSGPAAGAGKIPLSAPSVRMQDAVAATQPRKTLCFAERRRIDPDTRAVVSSSCPWAGLVMKRERALGDRAAKLSMVTLPSYFQRRTAGDADWTDADALTVQRALFTDGAACGWDGETPPVFARLTENTPTTAGQLTTTRSYRAADLTPVLEAATKVAGETGFDWRFVPYWDADAGRWRVRLDQGWPRLGRIAPADLRWSSDRNRSRAGFAAAGTILEDGSNANNVVTALGAGSGPTQLRATAAAWQTARDERASGYVRFEGAATSSTQDLRTQAAVTQHALGAVVAGLASETQVSGFQVRGDLEPDLDSYLVGDDLTFTVRDQLTDRPITVIGQLAARSIQPPTQTSTEQVTLDVQGTAA